MQDPLESMAAHKLSHSKESSPNDPTASPIQRFNRMIDDHHTPLPHRVQRKGSRSAPYRRPASDSPMGRQWHVEPNPHCNGGLHNAVKSVGGRLKRKLWVGTLGTNTDNFREQLRLNITRRMQEEHDSLPIWIPDQEFEQYYDMFCHQVLWPCLHYVVHDAPKSKYFSESSSFKEYVAVNQRFADAIVANYQEGDISTFLRPFPYFREPLFIYCI